MKKLLWLYSIVVFISMTVSSESGLNTTMASQSHSTKSNAFELDESPNIENIDLLTDDSFDDAQKVITPQFANDFIHLPSKEREQFKEAIRLLRSGQLTEFRRIQSLLKDYVLEPYLEQAFLFDRITLANRKEIHAFLDKYSGDPVVIPIRYRYLKLLARKQQTNLFLTYYKSTSDTSLKCHYLRFRLKTNESKDHILTEAIPLWLSGTSQPKACDPVFSQLEKHGFLNDELIWKRLLLALKKRNRSLIRYLTSKLSPPLQLTGRFALQSLKNPNHLVNSPIDKLDVNKSTEVVVTILAKHVWRHPEDSLRLLNKVTQRFQFSFQQKQLLARNIALSLASKDHPRAIEWLENIPTSEQDPLLVRWKLAHELRLNNWKAVNQWVSQTPPPNEDISGWAYWLNRSHAELGNDKKFKEGMSILAKERNYYGFLASAHLSVPPEMQDKPLSISLSTLESLFSKPSTQRAYELWQLNKNLSARREWNYLKQVTTDEEQLHLAVLAHQWGWHEQAIIGLAEAERFDAIDMRFPFAFKETMVEASNLNQLDLSLGYAVARRESAFMPDARSPVGAVGLMQLMPSTARFLTKKHKYPKSYSRNLTNPKINIALGTVYLKQLLNHYDGNLLLATASYNAGKHKVKRWLPEVGSVPADIWVETMPYQETRAYVKNVLAYQQIYRTILGNHDNLFDNIVSLNISKNKSLQIKKPSALTP